MVLGLIGPIGVPELLILLIVAVPVVAIIWIFRTLGRIRSNQAVIMKKLESIEEDRRRTGR